MRWLTLFLLLLNLGYFAWASTRDRDDQAEILVRSPAREAPRSLTLLGEIERPAAPQPPTPNACLTLTGFPGAGAAQRAVDSLRALGFHASLREQQVEEAPDWWVHMPPFVSETAARRRLEELKAAGIDSYLITGGDLARGISLGLFSRRGSALSVQEELAARGYPSSIREVPRSRTELRVEVAGLPPGGLGEAQWAALQVDAPGLAREEKLCETIAPTP